MAKTKQIIDLGIKAHIPIAGGIDEQAEVLNMLKDAHKTGDYSAVLARATIDGVKAETKRRRFDAAEPAAKPEPQAETQTEPSGEDDVEIPEFLKR